jgi:hypothetical protein
MYNPASFVQVVYSLHYLLENLSDDGFVVHEAAHGEDSLQVSEGAVLKDEKGEATIVIGGVLTRQAFICWLLHFMAIEGWLFIFGYCPRLNACLDTGQLLFRMVLASC